MNIDLKKAYYYIISLITFFVLLWGTVDFVAASTSYFSTNYLGAIPQEQGMDDFYQKRVTQERLFDSLSRILVSGIIFIYARKKAS